MLFSHKNTKKEYVSHLLRLRYPGISKHLKLPKRVKTYRFAHLNQEPLTSSGLSVFSFS